MDRFIKRALWQSLIQGLEKKEVGIILGARQVGKTTLIAKIEEYLQEAGVNPKNIFYYNLDDIDLRSQIKKNFRFIQKDIELKIGISLEQSKDKIYLFIDEGQKAPAIFELVKIFYDNNFNIKTVISGSSSINIKDKSAETLAGRVNYFYLSPLMFWEAMGKNFGFYQKIEEINNLQQLKELASEGFREKEEFQRLLTKMLFLGSLPKVLLADQEEAIRYLNNFLATYLDRDIKDIGSKIDLENFHLSFKYLTSYCADLFNFSKMSSDLGIKRDSLYRYFDLLEKTLIIKTVPPFVFPQLKNVFKSRKLFVFDNGVVNRLRGFIKFSELENARFLGKLFENFIFQNLYARSLNDVKKPIFYYFRDYQDHEIDLIYQRGETTIPIEVVYSTKINEKKLKNFARFFFYNPRSKYGLIFYLGEAQAFSISKKPVFAVPFFLV